MMEIAHPYLSPWEYWNKEYHCYALYYQVCVLVGTGEIIHFAGPFKGAAADITIAQQTIIPLLWPGEKLWADEGYPDSQYFISPYKSKVTLQQHKSNKAIYWVRQIVERSTLRMRQFAYVTHWWPYSWKLHQQCMIAQAKLVNFTLKKHPLDFIK
jgi:hypothetical protein